MVVIIIIVWWPLISKRCETCPCWHKNRTRDDHGKIQVQLHCIQVTLSSPNSLLWSTRGTNRLLNVSLNSPRSLSRYARYHANIGSSLGVPKKIQKLRQTFSKKLVWHRHFFVKLHSNVNLHPQHIIPVPSVATFIAPTSTRDNGLLHSFWIEFWPMPETSTKIWATLEIGWWLACLCFNQEIYTQKQGPKDANIHLILLLYDLFMSCQLEFDSWSPSHKI